MCKNISSWSPDPEVNGPHKMVPHTCDDYIEALEALVREGTADSISLETVQRTFGRLPKPAKEHRPGSPVLEHQRHENGLCCRECAWFYNHDPRCKLNAV